MKKLVILVCILQFMVINSHAQEIGVPMAIGADWRPYFRIIDNTYFGWGVFGFNVRLVL
jgi:hypothetical protein